MQKLDNKNTYQLLKKRKSEENKSELQIEEVSAAVDFEEAKWILRQWM